MAFAATISTSEPREFSLGPVRMEVHTYSAASADTSGTVTSPSLTNIFHIIIDGKILHTSAPSFSGNVVTLAFADPAATVYGTLILIGR